MFISLHCNTLFNSDYVIHFSFIAFCLQRPPRSKHHRPCLFHLNSAAVRDRDLALRLARFCAERLDRLDELLAVLADCLTYSIEQH